MYLREMNCVEFTLSYDCRSFFSIQIQPFYRLFGGPLFVSSLLVTSNPTIFRCLNVTLFYFINLRLN